MAKLRCNNSKPRMTAKGHKLRRRSGRGPVYVRSTSNRVEILCTAVKDAKCQDETLQPPSEALASDVSFLTDALEGHVPFRRSSELAVKILPGKSCRQAQ
jgi:hypothetical protein